MTFMSTRYIVDEDAYETRLIEAFCRLSDAVAMTAAVLGPQGTLGGTDADVYNQTAEVIERLAAAWPVVKPTLDEVREGKADITDHHIRNNKSLREDLEDAFRAHGCSPTLAKIPIEVLRRRRMERDGGTPTPADERHSNLTEPHQRAHFTKGYHPRSVTERVHVKGYSVQQAVMDHFVPRGEFGHEETQQWMTEAGYNPTSDSPCMFYLVRDGFCTVVNNRPRRWRFEKPMPAGYKFDFSDKHGA